MSEYYKQIREIILNLDGYKKLGIGIKFESFLYLCVVISSLWIAVPLLTGKEKSSVAFMICIGLCIGSFLAYFWCKRKYRHDRKRAIATIIEDLNIDIEIINLLIKEIEDYIKRVQTFGTWFIGVTATFIILFITFFTNYFFKLVDAIIDLGNDAELKMQAIEEVSNGNFVEQLFEIGGSLIIVVILFLLCFYSIFNAITFGKRVILYFLCDIRYQLLMSEEQKEKMEKQISKFSFMNRIKHKYEL